MLDTDVDSPEVIERVRQTIKDLKTLMLGCLDDPAQWQDEFEQAIAYFGDLLAKGRIRKATFERLCEEKLKGL
ncbi:hypothetical protein AN403_6056 [Pseudomonas fluorescens]|uniref:Uncharacterized protein n=1 Tax=Pseudomonas fluorescens TaxID=294 RepID=A0A0P8X707_PSEFL|nr:hypothetical protein [Pseudomonas fluorescens]KPU61955.1 hypothetical protein AN403_6056 [Pseudomonas fluorescens]